MDSSHNLEEDLSSIESSIVMMDSLLVSTGGFLMAGGRMSDLSWSLSLNSNRAGTCLGLAGVWSSVSVPVSSKEDILLDLLYFLLLLGGLEDFFLGEEPYLDFSDPDLDL